MQRDSKFLWVYDTEQDKKYGVIDTRGFICPISIVKIAKVMNNVNPGTVVEILSDDPSINKEIEQWCQETGNIVNSITNDDSYIRIQVTKGNGYKPKKFLDFVLFILLGIRLHIQKFFTMIFRRDMTKYLISFTSISEGMRAHYWLQDNHPTLKYILLPVPNDITKHCGVVLGTNAVNQAQQLYSLLISNNFKVEDIYKKHNYSYYPLSKK